MKFLSENQPTAFLESTCFLIQMILSAFQLMSVNLWEKLFILQIEAVKVKVRLEAAS